MGTDRLAGVPWVADWWKNWPAPPSWSVLPGPVVAAPGGGALVVWGEGAEDAVRTRVMRVNAHGDFLWDIASNSDASPHDATLGPDALLYVIEGSQIRPYLP